jgi:ElaB/YqjD/DUF883 family membrane-anchored ribosome-binding protein
MAEKPGELETTGTGLDPLGVNAGAGRENFGDTSMDLATTDAESLEMTENTGDDPPKTDHIRSQIEETRKELGSTIDAIQEKLSLSNVSEQVSETVSTAIESAKDTIYDATIGKAVGFMKNTGDGIANSGFVRTARNNPFPLLLIGLGAGLLAYQTYGRKGSMQHNRGRNRFLASGSQHRGQTNWERRDNPNMPSMRETGRTGESLTGKVTDTATNVYGKATDAAGNAYESVSGALNTAYSSAGDAVHKARETASDYGSKAYETYDYYIEENPLAVGAVAAALGVAVGFAIPASRFEGQMLGEYRENVVSAAQDKVNTLLDKAKDVAAEAGKTIKDEAQQALNT